MPRLRHLEPQALPPRGSGPVGAAAAFYYSAVFHPAKDGIWKSTDKGQTWKRLSQGLPADCELHEVAVSPASPLDVFIIGSVGWNGCFFWSSDGGQTWTDASKLAPDPAASPTLPGDYTGTTGLSAPRNLAINPLNPKELIIAANWRPCHSDNGGRTWTERVRGADISCVYDLRFHKGRTYASAMDEGVLVSDNNGKSWRALWPFKYDTKNPKTLCLGIDGDPSEGREGGGVFRSGDGGHTWSKLPGQPGSERMFFGLAVDPTDSKRLYWGACGSDGGLWRSEDGGATWQHVFTNEQWLFNVHVASDGTVYCPGKNLWSSADHGQTWKPLTKFPYDSSRIIVAVETDPADAKRMWFAATTWDGSSEGGVYETRDGGATWQEITSDLPYRKPLLLRYNAETHELWAAGVCLYKCKR